MQPQTGADTSPLFGTQRESSISRSTEERIFLNFEAPSQCKGNVTSWRFCYYRPSTDNVHGGGDDFGAMFIIYRRMSPTSDIYVPVTGSITSKILEYRDLSSFGCLDEPVTNTFLDEPVTNPIEIRENDIIGACIQDRGSINPLYLVGDTNSNSNNQKLYQLDKSGYEDCRFFQTGSVNTADSDFRLRDEHILHLYANIGEYKVKP